MNRITRLASLATVVLIVSAMAACPPQKPVVTEIEVVPGTVAVASDATQSTTFVLEVRLWTGLASKRSAISESDGIKLTWSVSPSGSGVSLVGNPDGYHATVRVDPGSNPAGPVTVKARAGGIGAEAQIVPSASSGDDQLEAMYTAGQSPHAVVTRGIRTAADQPCAVWLSPALVRLGLAGSVSSDCSGPDAPWGLALLDAAHAVDMYPVTWTTGSEKVPPPNPTTAIRSIRVAMRVLIGGTGNLSALQNGARSFTVLEIEDANEVFLKNRVGIKLDLVDTQTIPVTPPGTETEVYDCKGGDALTAGHDHASAMLHIYVVNYMGADALPCPGTVARPQTVIYLRSGRQSGTILLHEVGHVLGLNLPRSGHAEDLTGFDPTNVMEGGYADNEDVWRRRFTVGQVFRMNADPASWLNWAKDLGGNLVRASSAPRVECQCGADDPVGPCPRLVDDIARPRPGGGNLFAWDCYDLIKLPPLDPTEEPLALLAGRRWRTPPGECRLNFPGTRLTHDQAVYIRSINLTRAGSCPSWVAIFFPSHVPIFRDLEALPGIWSDAADLRLLDRPIQARTPVTVHVYYDPQDLPQVSAGIADAMQVYGPTNRSGIDLQFVFIQAPPGLLAQPCPAPPPGAYAICYSSAAGGTIPQLVGRALGLPALTLADQNNPAFAGNAMVAAAGTAGKLTLGQVFRIHSTIRTPGFPDCTITGTPCPPLDADVPP